MTVGEPVQVREYPFPFDPSPRHRNTVELSQADRDQLRTVARKAVDLAAETVKILIGAVR